MEYAIMKNWKTTLAGFGAGVLNLWASGISIRTALLSAAFAIFGWTAKDHDVTGGTIDQ